MTKSEIQQIRALHSKEGRVGQGLFICEGTKLFNEVMLSKLVIRNVYSTAIMDGIEKITVSEMSRISALKTSTEILATVEIPLHSISGGGLNLVLDGVQDPGNLGTIIRTADWFGIKDIYCSKNSADCFNPKVVQATMGAITRVKVHYVDLPVFLKTQKETIYGTFMDGRSVYDVQLSESGYIVMGNEGQGISLEVEACVNQRLSIPSFGSSEITSESLNVATATAIICSEFRRRKW